MGIRAKLIVIIVVTSGTLGMTSVARPADLPSRLEDLVQSFPTLDELENRLGVSTRGEGSDSRPALKLHTDGQASEGSTYAVSARWFTAPQPPTPFSGSPSSFSAEPSERPLASLLARMDDAQKEAGDLGKQIALQNNLPINKYLLDRWNAYARTDYGTDITGLFVNGVGFGSTQQTLRQTYGASYSLPLLQRFSSSTKWTRILSGYTIASDVGVMPLINPTSQLQQFLNNLQFSWSVSVKYNLPGGMVRRLKDDQYTQEAALAKATGRAAASRDELLNRLAHRIDVLSESPPVYDTRLISLRELYPQFELYQARFEQAQSCDERMENFFTLKGLALGLLTLAGYDRPDPAENDLLYTWKTARFVGCEKT